MSNTIEIKAVRAKDWRWWYVEILGAGRHTIATSFGSGKVFHVGIPYCTMTASSRRDLLRKLYRRLGVKKLDWEVIDGWDDWGEVEDDD